MTEAAATENKTETKSETDSNEEGESLFARAVVAVADGMCREFGPNVRKEFFEQFGSDVSAGVFLYIVEARAAYENTYEQEVYIETFLRSVASTIGKVGIRLSRGRVIPAAHEAAQAAVSMLHLSKQVIRKAQEQIVNQAAVQRQSDAIRSFTNGPAGPQSKIGDLLRNIGGV